MAVGMQVGLQFVLLGSPVSGALLGGLAGVILEFLIEKLIIRKQNTKHDGINVRKLSTVDL